MNLLSSNLPTPLIEVKEKLTEDAGVRLYLKRDDLIHPLVSGNKWRKLKYNLLEAAHQKANAILTFGGPYSNHLFAAAAAGKELGILTIGIVRGESHTFQEESRTLKFCKEYGMKLHYISRTEYRKKDSDEFLEQIKADFNNPFIIPEGGSSVLALKGVGEMTLEVEKQLGFQPDYYAVAVGTGGTTAGILSSGNKVISFPVLKGGEFLKNEIANLLQNQFDEDNLDLQTAYHFGGYGKWTNELLNFIRDFNQKHNIQLEQVYTGKMMNGLYDLVSKGHFNQNTTIVAVHTGGLQGLLPMLG